MSRAHELAKQIFEVKRELHTIQKQKHDMEMRTNQLNEKLWVLEGQIEEEQDEHEYRHT